MRRTALFLFNLGIGVIASTGLGLLFRGLAPTLPSLGTAFLTFGWAGLVVGATVGVGAVVGPREPLGWARSILAQALVAATSALGAFLGGLFPHAVQAADQAVQSALRDRGILVGSWLGALVGTSLEIIHVYRMRRREEGRPS